jgi:starch synthase
LSLRPSLCSSPGGFRSPARPTPIPRSAQLQTTAERTGKSIVLILAGHAFNPEIAATFEAAAAAFCPDVRAVFVDGRDPPAYRQAWAAADLFISLADSIQETFGITPLEAMAAGLPALVSDWNGYKDTVRDGVDGFRIRTWAPPPGGGASIAHDFEIGMTRYEEYLSRSNTAVVVDMGELVARLCDLATDEGLRRRMGAAGQARARSDFDWPVVFRGYQALWNEQAAIRRKALRDPATQSWLSKAPRSGPDHMGPFDTFAHYPTGHITGGTWVSRSPGVTPESYRELIGHHLMALSAVTPAIVDLVLGALQEGPSTVAHLAQATGITEAPMMEVVARLAKIDVVMLALETRW